MAENAQVKPNPNTVYDRIGIVTIVLSFLIIPLLKFGNEFIWIKTTVLLAVVMILTFLWLIRAVDRKEWIFPKTSVWIPMIIMLGVSVVHLVHVTDIWRAVDMMLRLGANIFFWFFTLLYVRKRSDMKWIIVAMAISVFIVSMFGIMQFYEILPCPYDIYGEKDPSSTIGLTNFSAEWMVGFIALLIFAFFLDDFNIETKTVLFFLFVPTYFYLLLTKARAAWMGFIVASVIIFVFFIYQWIKLWLENKRRLAAAPAKPGKQNAVQDKKGASGVSIGKRIAIMAIFFVLVGTGVYILSVTHFGKTKQFANIYKTVEDVEKPHTGFFTNIYDIFTSKLETKDSSINFRFMAWRSTFDLWRRYPVWGVGIGQVEVDIHKTQIPALQAIIAKTYQVFSESHNDWVQILAELGIIGFLAFLWIILNIVWKLVRVAIRSIDNEDVFLLALPIGAGITAVLIAAIFSFPLQEPASSMYFWGLIALGDVLYRGFDDADAQAGGKKQRRLAAPEMPAYLLVINPAAKGKIPVVLKKLVLVGCIIVSLFAVLALPIYAGRTAVAENHIKDGVAYRNRRDFNAAVAEFNDAISLNPFEYIYYFHRAIVLFNTGQIQQTISDLDQCLKMSPYFGLAYRLRGGAYFAENDCPKAAPDFEKALEYLPTLVGEIGNQLVACDVRLNKLDDVPKVAALQLKYNPQNKDAYYNLGNAMFLKGNYKAAIANYQKSIGIDPAFQGGMLNMAITYYYQKDFKDGDAYLEKAKQINTDNPILWYDKAIGLALRGQTGAALSNLKKAIDLKSDLRMSAMQEPSFASIKDTPAFKKLMGSKLESKYEEIEKLKSLIKNMRIKQQQQPVK